MSRGKNKRKAAARAKKLRRVQRAMQRLHDSCDELRPFLGETADFLQRFTRIYMAPQENSNAQETIK